MRPFALVLALLAAPSCASVPPAAAAGGGAGGLTIQGPADYCGSAARLRLRSGETITDLGATGIHGRVFTLNSGGRSISVIESDIAPPLRGEIVQRSGGTEIVRARSRRGGIVYALQAEDGRHVRLTCGDFTGNEVDLPLLLRFSLRSYDDGETCEDPGALI